MSKIVCVSDLHFDNRKKYDKSLSYAEFMGCNNRFHEIAKAFRASIRHAVKIGAEAVVIPGDIYHTRGILPIPVLNAVQKLFREAAEQVRLIVMVGNHDVVSSVATGAEQDLHSLFVSKDICTIVGTPTTLETDSFHLSFIPFTPSWAGTVEASNALYGKAKKSKKPTLAFFHHSFNGATTGPHEWTMPYPLCDSDIQPFDKILSGHVHRPQDVGRVRYIGTLIQQDMGEREYDVGWAEVDDGPGYKHISNTKSPRFMQVTAKTTDDLKLSMHDYTLVQWEGDPDVGAKLQHGENVLVEMKSPQVLYKKRTDISTADSDEDMFGKYIKVTTGSLNRDLLAYGLSLYKGAQ